MSSDDSVVNFGCRLNAYEAQVIRQTLKQGKLDNLAVFNTCAVTSEAERQAKQAIRKMRRKKPNVQIVVTGCAAQINPQQFANMAEVDFVIGNQLKTTQDIYGKLNHLQSSDKIVVTDIMQDAPVLIEKFAHFTDSARAFIQIQNGCNHRCTFCTIPYGRGNSRSINVSRIIAEMQQMVKDGFKEIVLTGVDITDYGNDFQDPITLGQLCKHILCVISDLPRLRLSSVDVAELDKDIIDLIMHEQRFMPHLHISAQSGDNLILKRMKRRHNREMIIEFCNKIRSVRPDIAFGSDIIAGFPTETDDMFQNTALLLLEANIVYNHIFTYSSRPNTPASRMPQVSADIKKQRSRILIEQTRTLLGQFLRNMIGSVQSVVMESEDTARTENFAQVKIAKLSDKNKATESKYNVGKIVEVSIIDSTENALLAKFL